MGIFGFRAAHVFDVSQTDGEPLPEFAKVKGDPKDYRDRLKQFVAGRNIGLEYDRASAPAQGMSSGGKITLMPDLAPADEFAVMVHEMAHELLHHGERRSETTHIIRETEAEAVAFVVCHSIGLDTNTSSADYIKLHAGDKATLAESLSYIQQTASSILQAIEPGGWSRTTPLCENCAEEKSLKAQQESPEREDLLNNDTKPWNAEDPLEPMR